MTIKESIRKSLAIQESGKTDWSKMSGGWVKHRSGSPNHPSSHDKERHNDLIGRGYRYLQTGLSPDGEHVHVYDTEKSPGRHELSWMHKLS